MPHIGTDHSEFRRKGFFIGYMANKLLSAFVGKADENDRDHYGKKRCDIAGDLLTLLFRDRFVKSYLSNGQKILQKMFNDGKNIGSDTRIERIFDEKSITDPIRTALSTGNWGSVNGIERHGVCHTLHR